MIDFKSTMYHVRFADGMYSDKIFDTVEKCELEIAISRESMAGTESYEYWRDLKYEIIKVTTIEEIIE